LAAKRCLVSTDKKSPSLRAGVAERFLKSGPTRAKPHPFHSLAPNPLQNRDRQGRPSQAPESHAQCIHSEIKAKKTLIRLHQKVL
jgi:hypothetical protein